ncbi:MAG: hypothetical protein LUP92_01310 [Methanomicrobiales archaeon]|nr:hypothetical protein [Methanomicrobiales archaeon]MDD1662741.1 hypothetical protein [Methanomicrobiales archaeon]
MDRTFPPMPADGIRVTDEVRTYVRNRQHDMRLCTSCGGPILLPTSIHPPKATDLRIEVGDWTVYVSRYQARYHDTIHAGMIPRFLDRF